MLVWLDGLWKVTTILLQWRRCGILIWIIAYGSRKHAFMILTSYDSVVNMRSNEDKKRLKITLSGFVLKVTSMLGCMAFRWNSKVKYIFHSF